MAPKNATATFWNKRRILGYADPLATNHGLVGWPVEP